MLAPNTWLDNRYRIKQEIGGGGQATVYLAEDRRLSGQECAIKELSPSQLSPHDRSWAIPAFQQEAQLSARLNHSGIVSVSNYFEEGGNWYLVMDYVPGQTLGRWLEQLPGGLPVQTALNYTIQLCDVLDYLHTRTPPIIFRDLKPDNIMVTPTGEIKLIDFGIARFFKPGQTHNTVNLGTPGYASPEHSSGQTDPRSDIYSLGVMLHQMVTGYDPTAAPFNFPAARSLNANVPEVVEDVIKRAVQLQPARRFQTVAEFRQALTYQQTPSLSQLPPKPSSRPKWVYVVTGVVAVALTVVVITSVIKPTSPSTLPRVTLSSSAVPASTDHNPDPSRTALVPANVTPDTPAPAVASSPMPVADPRVSAQQAVERFQELRVYAQHTGDTSRYSSVLKGNALDSAIKAVEDYKKQGCHMDITDLAPMSFAFVDVSDARVVVTAQRSETRALICSTKSTRYVCERYEGYYTVDRLADGWYVTDKGVRSNRALQPCP